jgi:hypothetical protein
VCRERPAGRVVEQVGRILGESVDRGESGEVVQVASGMPVDLGEGLHGREGRHRRDSEDGLRHIAMAAYQCPLLRRHLVPALPLGIEELDP